MADRPKKELRSYLCTVTYPKEGEVRTFEVEAGASWLVYGLLYETPDFKNWTYYHGDSSQMAITVTANA